jgi:hypothetical protein
MPEERVDGALAEPILDLVLAAVVPEEVRQIVVPGLVAQPRSNTVDST